MGGQHSIFYDLQKVKHFDNAFQHIQFSSSQKSNLNLQSLQRRKQTQVIKFKYNFVNFDPQEDKNHKEQQQSLDKISQNISQSSISQSKQWANYLNLKSLIIENQNSEDPDQLKIRQIKQSKNKQKKFSEFTDNQIMIKINIESLQSKEQKQTSIKQLSKIMEEQNSQRRYSQSQSMKSTSFQNAGSFVDLSPLKTLAFSYKSYSTRNILKNVVQQSILKKGVKQFVIVGPFDIQKQYYHIRRTFIYKILQVFYELNQKYKLKHKNLDMKKKSSGKKQQQKKYYISVLLIWQNIKNSYINQQLIKLRKRMSIKYEQDILP